MKRHNTYILVYLILIFTVAILSSCDTTERQHTIRQPNSREAQRIETDSTIIRVLKKKSVYGQIVFLDSVVISKSTNKITHRTHYTLEDN